MTEKRLRLLIKAHPAAERGRLTFGARQPAELRLRPLLPSIERPGREGLGAAAAPVWQEAALELEDVNPWEVCHALVRDGLGVAGAAQVSLAEPDLEQSWGWTTEARQALGLTDECEAPEGQMNSDYATGPTDFWHRGDGYSQLEAAQQVVARPRNAAERIRIAHLDTGYDPHHETIPSHLRLDLQKNFADEDNPDDAVDRETAVLNPMHGHGAGTLGLLAGKGFKPDTEGTEIPPVGGAPRLDVVPIRVANWVVLFRNSAIARALDYVHRLWDQPENRVHVVSMSMGGVASGAWADAVNALYELGVVVVTAAGNNFGNLPTRFIVYPARFDRVLAACGVMADGRPYADLPVNRMAGCYGPRHKEATAMAAYTPNVPWARFGCSEIVDLDGGGTSAATPQVAAAAALWMQKHRKRLGQYSDGWMRVEATRKALFDSAEKADEEYFGQGIVRARDALRQQPADAGALEKQDPDSASFSIFRVLTGLGLAELPPAGLEMLELEALQLSQRSSEVEAVLVEQDRSGPGAVDARSMTRLLEALADDPRASTQLKTALRAQLRVGGSVPPPTAPAKTGDGSPPRPADRATTAAVPVAATAPPPPEPPARRLRVYTFDPLLGTRLETMHLNETVIEIPWEDDLQPGPVGEYLEIVDVDPPSDAAYAPVDLNDRKLLAQDGLPPSEGVPQFHQQMVYAVVMRTIGHFERALGRVALWAERMGTVDGAWAHRFVRRLRIYPHALREANAFYSPDKKALLFGYFSAPRSDAGDNLPGGLVFTCLSHDIVAHEATHALLDGLHPRFKEPTNVDMLAFHEAFADIVALFQHFTLPDALRDQIARTQGDLGLSNLLGGLAMQFGQALKKRGALRSAISEFDEASGEWKPIEPSQDDYESSKRPHTRGAVLVAAVFDAFLQIYRHRTEDLVRLATSGTGVLPPGRIPADLIERLAREAAKTAGHVLNICIRALDYCPPIDLTFGDYLRALVTADCDVVPEDDRAYRVAFISAFRARGIFPARVQNLSTDALLWERPAGKLPGLKDVLEKLKEMPQNRWTRKSDRFLAYMASNESARALHRVLLDGDLDEHDFAALGLVRTKSERTVEIDGRKGRISKIEVHSVRPARRVGPNGRIVEQLVIELTQRFKLKSETFRGGCTIIYDLKSKAFYLIRKRLGDSGRMDRQRDFQLGMAQRSADENYFGGGSERDEPFALLHRD